MNKIKLNSRLKAVSEFVSDGGVLADIGTDHAYLPTFLVSSGKIKSAIAADINTSPLNKAKETIEEYGLSDKITMVLSDGLKKIDLNNITDISIAGMGGELICDIIDDCPELKLVNINLILQPMTNADALRRYLCENGFEIIRERAVIDRRFIYCIIIAKYNGICFTPSETFCKIGKLSENKDKESKAYIINEIKKINKKIIGIEKSRDKSSLDDMQKLLEQIKTEVNYDDSTGCI